MVRLVKYFTRLLARDFRELYEAHRDRAVYLLIKNVALVVSALLLGIFIMLIAVVALILLGIALGFLLGSWLGSNALGFLLSAVIWLIVGLCLYLFRRQLIETPVVVRIRKILYKQ